MQPHTGAALCVFSFLIPDLERVLNPPSSNKIPVVNFLIPNTQFNVSSRVPPEIFKEAYKMYSITVDIFNDKDELVLAIGQTWHCYLRIRISRFSSSDIMVEFNHSHSGTSEKFRMYSDTIDGNYDSVVRKDNERLRSALMITVDRDVRVAHRLEGRTLMKRSFPLQESGEESRTNNIEVFEYPTKETNPARKFVYPYRYEIDSINSPKIK